MKLPSRSSTAPIYAALCGLTMLFCALSARAFAVEAVGNGSASISSSRITGDFTFQQSAYPYCGWPFGSLDTVLGLSTSNSITPVEFGPDGTISFCGGMAVMGTPGIDNSNGGILIANNNGPHAGVDLASNFNDGSAVPTLVSLDYQDDTVGVLLLFGCDVSGNCASRGALSGSSDGTHEGTTPPTYSAAGAAAASSYHCVKDVVTASGASTSVTLSGPAAFGNADYTLSIENVTALASINPSAQASGSFSFASINTDVYSYLACGT